ncbi:proton-coupled folate transporter-like [Daktulosphaira vitifoliae]|uniref:proton-coupled folate transporter-like n=1 Tax=Daktulosphaira vitifoliae TaxID=58002 RepID=UPI0021AAB175|nr:proton-coupled folate transporter-like [Daktulosphaira vitifoliae]
MNLIFFLYSRPKWTQNITVEPMVFLYFITLAISGMVGTNLIYRKSCDETATDQPNLELPCPNKTYALTSVANINTWKLTIQEAVPIVFLLFAGPWSDSHGRRRRPLMFIPIIGQLVIDIFNLISVYYWRWPPSVAAIFACFLTGITGSRNCFVVGVISYISDITEVENRTQRIGILISLYLIASPIGDFVAGFLNVSIGFYGIFLVCIILNISALIFGLILVKNTSIDYEKVSFWKSINPKIIINTMEVLIKKRPKKNMLVYMVIVSPLILGPLQGEFSILYLLVIHKFGWQEEDYSIYAAYRMVIMLIGTSTAIWMFSIKLKLHDSIIGVISSSLTLVATIGYILIISPWQFYAIPLIDIFHGAGYSVSISIASKLVENTELAQLSSVRGIMETLLPVIIFPLYNQVYQLTFEAIPGAVFFLSFLLTIPVTIIFWYSYKIDKDCINVYAVNSIEKS